MSSEIAEDLSKQTSELVSRFEGRASAFAHRPDLAALTVQCDRTAAVKTARKFFGDGEHVATGVDGSMDFDERLQMILFYANATAYSCPFSVTDELSFDLHSAHREAKLAASAAIPLWSEDLSSVSSSELEIDIDLEHSMEKIPNSFMTLGELYLGYLACEGSRILFLDRPLSGTYSVLSREARYVIKRGESKLTKWSPETPLSMLDIYLAVYLGSPAMVLPTRTRFLPFAFLKELIGGPSNVEALASKLKVSEAEGERAAAKLVKLDKKHNGAILADSTSSHLELRAGVAGYWNRVLALALRYAKEVFARSRHPLTLKGDEFLTILDVDAVSLFLLQALLDRAHEKRALLIGIAKDTSATDVARSVLPFASSRGFVGLRSSAPTLKNDRAFLSLLSSENPDILTPWRTMGYDAAFSTIVEIGGQLISARKVVSREQVFVRSYFQLRTLRNDNRVRSQVFLFDRAFDPVEDSGAVRGFEVKERSGAARVAGYFEGDVPSDLSNMALQVLALNDNPEVFEAFGHNQLLYLADKAVKAEVRMLRSSLRAVADLRVGGVTSRRKIFGLVTPYRQQRAEAEHARMK
ncbi:MAG: hypothetical protein JRM99_04065 [Nitrososphaerota archaeon]|nr:hypothetical protein [Nitrososphaerota archaeon]MDG6990578.1 hypothetical protein [Nitrososphaerota archaeon]